MRGNIVTDGAHLLLTQAEEKINELIEQSNRQDEAIRYIAENLTGNVLQRVEDILSGNEEKS